jgi:hypothetical protein
MKIKCILGFLLLLQGCVDEPGNSDEPLESAISIGQSCTVIQADVIVAKFSRQMSPQAKKALLRAKPGDWIRGTLLFNTKIFPEDVIARLLEMGTEPGNWSDTTRQLSIRLPVACLADVLELPEVMYFEAATTFSYSPVEPTVD